LDNLAVGFAAEGTVKSTIGFNDSTASKGVAAVGITDSTTRQQLATVVVDTGKDSGFNG